MNGKLKKKLRTIGHGLKAVVTVADNGLSENVIAELNRALDDHELIKVKMFGDKAERAGVVASLKDIPDTVIVQVVGGACLSCFARTQPGAVKHCQGQRPLNGVDELCVPDGTYFKLRFSCWCLDERHIADFFSDQRSSDR